MTVSAQTGTLRITSPAPDSIVSGAIRLEAAVTPAELIPAVQSVTFFVNGRLVCTADRPPFGCAWDPGDVVRGHHIRVVATLNDGRPPDRQRPDEGSRTRREGPHRRGAGPGHRHRRRRVRARAEAAGFRAVRGRRGAAGRQPRQRERAARSGAGDRHQRQHGELARRGEAGGQAAALASCGPATPPRWSASTTPCSSPPSARRIEPTREEAVDLLTSWGGTALYDATVRTLDLVSREWGRKGVVIFSDGDDRNSLTRRETAMARVQASDAMLYTIGFGGGATVPPLRSSLETYAQSTGGRAFFPTERRRSSTASSTTSSPSSPISTCCRTRRPI